MNTSSRDLVARIQEEVFGDLISKPSDQVEFDFKGIKVPVFTVGNKPWFVAKVVADVLGYATAEVMHRRLDADEKQVKREHSQSGLVRNQTLISESGLYKAIMGSRKPEAIEFKNWVAREVLPAIARTGGYNTKSEGTIKLDFNQLVESISSMIRDAIKEELDDRFGSSKVVRFPSPTVPTKNYDSEPWDCTYNFLKTKTTKVHPTKLGAQSRKLCEKYGVIKREGCHPQNIYVKTGYYPISILEETYRGIVNV